MKSRQKSRSGCRKCKEKRLKCDEGVPACENCLRRGFTCPGYQQRLQWSTKYERRSDAHKPEGPSNFTQLAWATSVSITHDARVLSPTQALQTDGAPDVPSITEASGSRHSSIVTLPDLAVGYSEYTTSLVLAEHDAAPADTDQPDSRDPALTRTLIDIPSFLIEHWFKSVLHSWSAYDSDSNPWRQLTSSLWTSSSPVYWALQVISAASLVERLPHVIRETASAAPQKAAEAIHEELVAFARGDKKHFPTEILLSLFCMSQSLCWMEPRQLGHQYVRQARVVLNHLNSQESLADQEQQQLLDFFNGCLIYEEMLRSVVSDDDVDAENMLSWPEPQPPGSAVLAPHAWTAVSPAVLRLFGKAMALCRRSQNRWRRSDASTYRSLQSAMMDIEESRAIEESLLAIEALDLSAQAVGAEERHSAAIHVRFATEAYRLSSLLQLYLTFPDLVATRIPSQVDPDGSVPWSAWVSPLALHISDLLEKIPPSSMRCIQPLLCLCVGSGLRYDKRPAAKLVPRETVPGADDALHNSGLAYPSTFPEDPDVLPRIARARRFVTGRLEQLELILPPKPIGVAKQLLRAVWLSYEKEIDASHTTHWLSVMTQTGLQSLFG